MAEEKITYSLLHIEVYYVYATVSDWTIELPVYTLIEVTRTKNELL